MVRSWRRNQTLGMSSTGPATAAGRNPRPADSILLNRDDDSPVRVFIQHNGRADLPAELSDL